jgi:hypothetical protein
VAFVHPFHAAFPREELLWLVAVRYPLRE